MSRLTSAEYAKTHGAKAAKELHAEREARTAKINRRIAENTVRKDSFARSLPGRLVGMATENGRLSNPKGRGDWKSLFMHTKFATNASEGDNKGQPLTGAKSTSFASDYIDKKRRGFQGWSKNQRVDLASLQHNADWINKWVDGWTANHKYNQMAKAEGLPPLIKDEHRVAGKDVAFDKNNALYKLAAQRLGKPYEYHPLKPNKNEKYGFWG